MPRGNGTGPMGIGRMTGRGMGICAGFETPGSAKQSGFGYGFGRGHSPRKRFCATSVPGWAHLGHPGYSGAQETACSEKTF